MQRILRLAILFILVACSTTKAPIAPKVTETNFYKNYSTLSWVKLAVDAADCVTINPEFHQEIINYQKFAHYDGSSTQIVKDLLSDKKAEVSTYYKRFTKARAYRNVGTNKIWLNRAKLGYVDPGLVNTMIHERLHVLGYNHQGNNKYKYNNVESVPYKVGKISEKYAEKCINR